MQLASGRRDPYKKLVEGLRSARTAAGVRQVDLALRLGRPQSYVSRVESGELALGLVDFVHWTRSLNLDPATVMQELTDEVPLRRRALLATEVGLPRTSKQKPRRLPS